MLVASDFAARLTELRTAAKLSQYGLAKAARISKQAVNMLEKGESEPTWQTVRRLARALGVSVEEFDTEDDPRGSSLPARRLKKVVKKKPKK